MREILFRGKRVDNGEWVYGYYCGGNERGTLNPAIFSYLSDKQSYDCQDINIETLGQYTGLTDKNGKKIFEGDILRNNLTKEYNAVSYDSKGDYAGAYVFDGLFLCDWDLNSFSIAGNTHDNPDLLEDKRNE